MLMEDVKKGYQEAKKANAISFSKDYRVERKDQVLRTMTSFADRFSEKVFLLTKDSEFCGAVELDSSTVFHHCAELLTLDGDSLMVCSKDREQGLLLDLTRDDNESCYELTVWGSKWPVLTLGCST